MRNIIILLVAVILSGCDETVPVDLSEVKVTLGGDNIEFYTRNKAYMFGDSICKPEQNKNGVGVAIGYKDVILDCLQGRKLVHFPYVPPDAKFIFLSGGTNDNNQGEDLVFFEERLQHYTQHPDVIVVCVIPNAMPLNKPNSEPFRQVMINNCTDYIDPVPDCGVQILNEDGIHYYQSDRDSLGQCLHDKLLQYDVI